MKTEHLIIIALIAYIISQKSKQQQTEQNQLQPGTVSGRSRNVLV